MKVGEGYLRKILDYKMVEVNRMVMDLEYLGGEERCDGGSFYHAIKDRSRAVGIIAEFKRASPSYGWINKDAVLEEYLQDYNVFADAISILTDNRFFSGDINDIKVAMSSVDKPILAKDFVIDERQIYLFSRLGVSAVLIIARILEDVMLKKLCELAESLGILPFIEVYSLKDVDRVFSLVKPKIIAINNRDLESFKIDFFVFDKVYDYVRNKHKIKDVIIVSASGVANAKDVNRIKGRADAILVGTSIMRAMDRKSFLEGLVRWCE